MADRTRQTATTWFGLLLVAALPLWVIGDTAYHMIASDAVQQTDGFLVSLVLASIAALLGVALLAKSLARRRQSADEPAIEAQLREVVAARDEAVALLNQEVTGRERAEGIVRQVQKMDVLGQLTGGIAHDFNNMLAVIVTNLETMQRRLATDEPRLREPLALALQGAERGALMTHRLLAFARRQPLEPRPADINKLVAGMSNFIRRTLGESIAVETALDAEIWPVHCDINQLENALLNLAVNARDAMPQGGVLIIETANVQQGSAAVAHADITQGDYVKLAVRDTGIGMAQETIDKAFEPFFTTKEPGHGTGLGLSQVYGFVRQSSGHVYICSEAGRGTTVEIFLPRLASITDENDDTDSATERTVAPIDPQTILVVEDNEFLATSVQEILRDQGYHVLLAPDGETALRTLASRSDIDLLFTDIGLPGGLDGQRLAEEAQRRWPGLKVLFTTGYGSDAIIGGVELIVKPFTYTALVAKIRGILARQQSPIDG